MPRPLSLRIGSGTALLLMSTGLLWSGLLSCAGPDSPTTVPSIERSTESSKKSKSGKARTFNAALFPYIPDSGDDAYAALKKSLEQLFEKQNPGVDLRLTVDPSMDVYDPDTLKTLLGDGDDAYDMVEVDTLLLGDLVADGLVQALPFDVSELGAMDAALEAATVESVAYGVPTYLCGNFIYSWDGDLRLVGNAHELMDLLRRQPDPNATPLVGNFKGSWTLPGFYVDDWADTHSNLPHDVAASYELPLDDDTLGTLSSVFDLCGTDGGPCFDGTYKGNTEAETAFAEKRANGFVGYSERLYYILKARPKADEPMPWVISAPLGRDSRPLVFVDALVLNPSCQGACAEDAEAFSRFMSSLPVRNLIAFSLDVRPKTYPRYLLQAREDFYYSSPARENVVYRQLRIFLEEARAFPNQGFPEAREALNQALEKALDEEGEPSEAIKGKG